MKYYPGVDTSLIPLQKGVIPPWECPEDWDHTAAKLVPPNKFETQGKEGVFSPYLINFPRVSRDLFIALIMLFFEKYAGKSLFPLVVTVMVFLVNGTYLQGKISPLASPTGLTFIITYNSRLDLGLCGESMIDRRFFFLVDFSNRIQKIASDSPITGDQ